MYHPLKNRTDHYYIIRTTLCLTWQLCVITSTSINRHTPSPLDVPGTHFRVETSCFFIDRNCAAPVPPSVYNNQEILICSRCFWWLFFFPVAVVIKLISVHHVVTQILRDKFAEIKLFIIDHVFCLFKVLQYVYTLINPSMYASCLFL